MYFQEQGDNSNYFTFLERICVETDIDDKIIQALSNVKGHSDQFTMKIDELQKYIEPLKSQFANRS